MAMAINRPTHPPTDANKITAVPTSVFNGVIDTNRPKTSNSALVTAKHKFCAGLVHAMMTQ